MTIRQIIILSAGALLISSTRSEAGPCFNRICGMAERVQALLQAKAAVGPPAPESTEAKLHRQPTPGSIAATELRLGVLSPEAVDAVRRGIARAHEADRNGDLAACERALANVQSAIESDQ